MNKQQLLTTAFARIGEVYRDLEEHLILSRDLGPADQAFGYKFILGINKWITDRYFLGFDRIRPRFIKFGDEFSQWGFSNPDNAYWIAEIAGDQEYVLRGMRGTSVDLVIETRTGIGRKLDDTHSRTIDSIDVGSLVVEPDGSYEVRIGGEPSGPNCLPTGPDAEVVFVRQTFADWDSESVAPFHIENVRRDVPQAEVPSPEAVATQLNDIAEYLGFLAKFNARQALEFGAAMLTNEFRVPGQPMQVKSAAGMSPGQLNAMAQFRISPDEAMVVTFEPPAARYMGFSLTHPYWLSPLDFENRQTSLNLKQARVSSDGRIRLFVCNADPGLWNWIDCQRMEQGYMSFRCQGLEGTFAKPEVKIVSKADLPAIYPDEDRITPPERLAVLARRRVAVHRRYF